MSSVTSSLRYKLQSRSLSSRWSLHLSLGQRRFHITASGCARREESSRAQRLIQQLYYCTMAYMKTIQLAKKEEVQSEERTIKGRRNHSEKVTRS
jgi:hypothetical protein